MPVPVRKIPILSLSETQWVPSRVKAPTPLFPSNISIPPVANTNVEIEIIDTFASKSLRVGFKVAGVIVRWGNVAALVLECEGDSPHHPKPVPAVDQPPHATPVAQWLQELEEAARISVLMFNIQNQLQQAQRHGHKSLVFSLQQQLDELLAQAQTIAQSHVIFKTQLSVKASASTDTSHRYLSDRLHRSRSLGYGEIPLIPGISSRPVPINLFRGTKATKVLFLSLFPLNSNGSGIWTQAMARAVMDAGGEARALVLSHDYGKPGIAKYILPYANNHLGALPGAALAGAPFFDGNAAVTGRPYREMSAPEIIAYTENVADGVATASRDFHPDMIIVNHAWVGAEAARRTGIPYIVVAHGSALNAVQQALKPNSTYPRLWADISAAATQQANHVVAVSKAIRESIVPLYQLGINQSSVIYNGYDANIFYPKPDITRQSMLEYFGINPHSVTHVVAYAGRMTGIKGVETGIHAARRVIDQFPGAHFLLAGSGQYLDNYIDLAKRLQVDGNMHFLGHRDQDDLVHLYNGSDVLMVPSNFEAFGIVAAEAAATGTPVIASNVGGLPEVVTENVGRIVHRGQPDELATQIIRTLQLGIKSFHRDQITAAIQSRFSWARSGELFMKLIHSILH